MEIIYHENGKLETIDKNGKQKENGNSIYIKWKASNWKLKNGKQEGEWKFYRENGKLDRLEIIKMESEKEGNSIMKMES